MPIVECSSCKKKIKKKNYDVQHYKRFYCSVNCRSKGQLKGNFFECKICEKKIWRSPASQKRSKSQLHFCSRKCSTVYNNGTVKSGENHFFWKDGRGSYRNRALKFYGKKCMNINCPITFPIPEQMLDVHHKDENRSNNNISNLEVLCVWCHALKTRNLY
jgi:hypothetical protein